MNNRKSITGPGMKSMDAQINILASRQMSIGGACPLQKHSFFLITIMLDQ